MLIAVVLLFSLLLSSCGMPAQQTETIEIETEPERAVVTVTEPAPAQPEVQTVSTADYAPRLLANTGSKPEPTTVQTDMFSAKFEGSAVAGKGEAVDGVYRFTADETDGEAWHVKLECNYPTVAGRDYRVTYRFNSDVAGKIKFGDFQEFEIEEGENSVTGMMIASGGTSYLDLQLGMLPPFTIDFREIEVEEFADEVEYKDALSAPVNFEKETVVYEKHDQGYAPVLTRGSGEVSINYLATSWESGVWKSKLFVKTGLIPEKGARYRVTADVGCDGDMPFELLFNDGDVEKGYGALYGQDVKAGETKTCEAVIMGNGEGEALVLQFSLGMVPEEAADLILQFNLGWATAPCTVTVSNVKVEEMAEGEGESVLPSFSYDSVGSFSSNADDGYIVALNKTASSAEFKIIQAPAENRNPWNVKLNIKTGFTPEKDKGYRVSFDLNAAKPQGTFEVFFDGSSEGAYGQFFGPALAGGKTSFSQIIYPGASKGELVLRLRCGKTNGTDGNTYTVSNVKIEEVSFTYVQTPEKKEVTTLDKQPDYNERLEKTPERARVVIEKTPAEGKEPWKSKLFVETGVTLKAGEKYRVSMDVKSIVPAPFEVCFNNGGEEKGLGAIFGLIATPSGTYVEYVTYPKQDTDLVIQLSLGNCSAPNSIFLSDVKVEKAGTIIPVSDTIYTF